MKNPQTQWPAVKAQAVLAAIKRIGWHIKRQKGSHRILARPGWPDYVFAYHDNVEVGPVALTKIGKKTGLRPEEL
jgi:predicted RNA binding protein YcfA (HicA-like mRNA interferase family)